MYIYKKRQYILIHERKREKSTFNDKMWYLRKRENDLLLRQNFFYKRKSQMIIFTKEKNLFTEKCFTK